MEITRKQIHDQNGHLRNTSMWNIEVDAQSEEELKKLLSWSKNMLGNLRSNNGFMSKNKHSKEVFESCVKIYNTDTLHLYEECESETTYYVYAHCDPNKKIAIGKHGITTFAGTIGMQYHPFYIGMGQGSRAYDLDRNDSHRKYRQKIKKSGLDVSVCILKENLTKNQALSIESKLIDIFGLIVNKGCLVNLDEGKNYQERRQLYEDELIKIGRLFEINKNIR